MDNIAHTLVGAALGRAVADHRAPAPALLGAFAANVPDIAELFLGLRPGRRSDYITLHRGITHSLIGALVEVALLTLAAVTVASHLFMDWQGSYGLRPFLPWSGRWYYGDWVAIVDPFFWLVPLVALVWGARRHAVVLVVFAVALAGCDWLVLSYDDAAAWLGPACVAVSIAGLAGWALPRLGPGVRRTAAAWSGAKRTTRAAARERFGADAQWATLTDVGRPFTWEPVIAGRDTVAGPGWALPRHLDNPRVRAALATERGRAIASFARFLVAEVDSTGSGVTVYLRDARYARTSRGGWAVVVVTLSGE